MGGVDVDISVRLLSALFGVLMCVPCVANPITWSFGAEGSGQLSGTGDNVVYTAIVAGQKLRVAGYKGVVLAPTGADASPSFTDAEAVSLDLAGTAQGLGVFSGGTDDALLDGLGHDEALLFSFEFSPGVYGLLQSIQFDNFGSDDDFNLVVDGFVALVDAEPGPGDRFTGDVPFQRHFALGADSVSDEFRVRSITLDVRNRAAVAAPAALSAPLLAVLIFVAVRRRRASVLAAPGALARGLSGVIEVRP